MVTEEEFHEILKKKGLVEECRKLWWKHWKQYPAKSDKSKELLENLVEAAVKNGCRAPCGL